MLLDSPPNPSMLEGSRHNNLLRRCILKSPDEFIEELWSYANEVPMVVHPWFEGIVEHRWTREQIVLGEVQHYLRVRTNPIYFGYIAVNAVSNQEKGLMDVVLENFMEELSGTRTHVDIMYQFLDEAGISREEADNAEPTPGTIATPSSAERLW